jgi:cation transport ATPase
MSINNELPDIGPEISPANLDLPAPDMALDLPPPTSEPSISLQGKGTASEKAKRQEKAIDKKPSKPKKRQAFNLASIQLEVVSIGILIVFLIIMFILDVPLDIIPSFTLLTYVQAIWLFLGCFFVMAMLQDIKSAAALTGIDIAIMATLFPTLWLLFDMRMNPLYFFVLTLIMLIAFIYIPLNLIKAKKEKVGVVA